MQDTILYLVPALAVVGLIYMFVQSRWVRSQSAGEEKMSTIAKHIHEGALAFLSAEYRILAVFVVVAGALLGLVSMLVPTTHWFIVIAFVIGAVFSALAGNIGMRIATVGNVRTTVSANKSLSEAFNVALHSGSVMGFGLVSLASLGLLLVYLLLEKIMPAQLIVECWGGSPSGPNLNLRKGLRARRRRKAGAIMPAWINT